MNECGSFDHESFEHGLTAAFAAVEPSNPDTPGVGSLQFMQHNHSLNSLAYLLDKVRGRLLMRRPNSAKPQDDKKALEEIFTKLSKDGDDDDDMDEEIVFAPPEVTVSDEEEEYLDLRIQRLPPHHEPHRRRSFPLVFSPPVEPRSPAGISPVGMTSGSSFQTSLLLPNYSSQRFSPDLRSPRPSTSSAFHSPYLSPSPARHAFDILPLPANESQRHSVSSFNSFEIPAPDAFQLRRKRVAKLTKFFGTDYRSLFGEVLESLESGVREDRSRGSLTQEETEVCTGFDNLNMKLTTNLSVGTPSQAS